MRPAILLLGAFALPCAGIWLSDGIDAGAGDGSHRQRCLKFMHLPKNAGSSIEAAGLALPRAEQPFRSFKSDIPGQEVELWWIQQPDGDHCKIGHTAPRDDRDVAAYFSEDGCETFCVVREPVSRFLSAARMRVSHGGLDSALCTPGEFENFTRSLLTTLRNRPWEFGCTFSKQVDMVYGAQRKGMAQTQYCTRILSFENINNDFNSLMLEYGSNLTLPEEHYASYRPCDIGPDNITTATKDMILAYYREDVAAFGYNGMA